MRQITNLHLGSMAPSRLNEILIKFYGGHCIQTFEVCYKLFLRHISEGIIKCLYGAKNFVVAFYGFAPWKKYQLKVATDNIKM